MNFTFGWGYDVMDGEVKWSNGWGAGRRGMDEELWEVAGFLACFLYTPINIILFTYIDTKVIYTPYSLSFYIIIIGVQLSKIFPTKNSAFADPNPQTENEQYNYSSDSSSQSLYRCGLKGFGISPSSSPSSYSL